jgi:hypothetical protein
LNHRNRPFFAGFQDTSQNFLAIESLPTSVFLDDHVRDFVDSLVAGKAPFTFQALPSPANGIAVLTFSRVDDLVVEVTTKWTFHFILPSPS